MATINKKFIVRLEKSITAPIVEKPQPSFVENAYNNVLNFIKEIPGGSKFKGAYSIQTYLTTTIKVSAGPCHSGMFEKQSQLFCLGGGFQYSKNDYYGPRFWEWLVSNKSPWKSITSGGIELILDKDGNGRGWILSNQETLKKVPFGFLKNFCITSRTVTEHPKKLSLWYDLVEKHKMDEAEAFYLVSMYQYHTSNDLVMVYDTRNGGHWPLSDAGLADYYNSNYVLDWKKFKSGEINEVPYGPKINGFWTKRSDGKYKGFITNNVKSKDIGNSKFSSYIVYRIEDVLIEFSSWKKKQGIT